MKVLVAEDTRSNLLFMKTCIESLGFDVCLAETGTEALTQFKKYKPDLVLLDVNMPELNGIEVAKKIRDTERRDIHWVPIIFISAMDKDADVVKGLETGGDDYITKPVSQAVLNAKLRAMKRIYDMQLQLAAANRQLKQFADHDPLTGLANRRKFDEVLRKEWSRAMRLQSDLSLCIGDIDYFKQYNDSYGHQVGDAALMRVANILNRVFRRPGDLVARIGGEEFAIVMPETDHAGAMMMLERARQAMLEEAIPHQHSQVAACLTISMGLTTARVSRDMPVSAISDLIKQADNALYQAKAGGRNQAVSYQSTITPDQSEVTA